MSDIVSSDLILKDKEAILTRYPDAVEIRLLAGSIQRIRRYAVTLSHDYSGQPFSLEIFGAGNRIRVLQQ